MPNKQTEQELMEKIAIQLAFAICYFNPHLPVRTKWEQFTNAEQVALLEQAKPIVALTEEYYKEKYRGWVELAGNQTLYKQFPVKKYSKQPQSEPYEPTSLGKE